MAWDEGRWLDGEAAMVCQDMIITTLQCDSSAGLRRQQPSAYGAFTVGIDLQKFLQNRRFLVTMGAENAI
jgi:hypothetical protein